VTHRPTPHERTCRQESYGPVGIVRSVHALSGGCHCGGVRVTVELTRAPDTYHPRACDCDFCRKHAAAWISDRDGRVRIHSARGDAGVTYRQGSGQAELLLCGNCGVLVAALYRREERLFAAVNARAIDGGAGFASEQPVSPKTLSDGQKAERWQDIWFSNVTIQQIDPIPAEASRT
jgi:hypothetical protein